MIAEASGTVRSHAARRATRIHASAGLAFRVTSGRSRRGRLVPRLCAVAGALLVAVSPGLSGTAAAAPPTQPTSSAVVVQLRAGADADLLSRQAARGGGRVTHVFRSAVTGFAGTFPDAQVAALRRDPLVVLVEPDAVVSATAATSVWGLDRVDQRRLPLSGTYTAPASGAGVTAYVVDTGISPHPDFGTRLRAGHTEIADGRGTKDCGGHGTHVAGTLGGTARGVAPGVRLVPVRVLDCAGNGGWDSCSMSPSRVTAALTVGATDRTDRQATFSDYGPCLDLFAPGVDILSDRAGGGTVTMSGTSMASPHVAGAAAVLLARQPALTPAQVAAKLSAAATTGTVTARGTGSPTVHQVTFALPEREARGRRGLGHQRRQPVPKLRTVRPHP